MPFSENDERIPQSIRELALIVGPDAADLIWRHYAGTKINVPGRDILNRISRDRRIVRMAKTMPVGKVAERFGLSSRQIWRILGNVNMAEKEETGKCRRSGAEHGEICGPH